MSERDVDIDITILPQREDPEITIIVEPDDITDNHLSDAELIKSIRVLEVDLNADASGELTIPTLQENQAAAEQFCTQLRRNWPQFDTQHKFNHYENEPRDKWFAISDLVAAADALDIPMAVQIVGGNHYCLVLTTPKFNDEDKKWHYRLYDPMDDREKSYAFEAVSANYDDFRTKNQHLGTSKKADSLFKTDGYDLTFDDDSQLSERQSILRAKTGRVQFNAHD